MIQTHLKEIQERLESCPDLDEGRSCLLQMLDRAKIHLGEKQIQHWAMACQQCGPKLKSGQLLILLHNECMKTEVHCFLEAERIDLFHLPEVVSEKLLDHCFTCLCLGKVDKDPAP